MPGRMVPAMKESDAEIDRNRWRCNHCDKTGKANRPHFIVVYDSIRPHLRQAHGITIPWAVDTSRDFIEPR